MTTQPKIELKNIKHAEFASEETNCFQATVYVDGKRFCIADNEGHGGPDRYSPLQKGKYKELDETIHEIGLRANPKSKRMYEDAKADRVNEVDFEDWGRHMLEDPGHTTLSVFEHLVGEALTIALYAKDMKSALRRKWIFQKTPDGSLFECKRLKDQKPEIMLEVIRKKDPEAQLLNAMPETNALELWRANG